MVSQRRFVGKQSVITDARGNTSFTFELAQKVPKGWLITATATDSGGNTSEPPEPEKVVRKR